MPYRRFRTNPVKRDKHEITWSLLGVNASVIQGIGLSTSVDVGTKTTSTDAAVGSHIYGIYLEFQFSHESTTSTTIVHWNVVGERTGQTQTVPSLYYQDDRSQIFKRGMEMLPKSASTVIKRIVFVRIPKAWQRQAQANELIFQFIASNTNTINACGIAIYKEIY